MYWLLTAAERKRVRDTIDDLVRELSVLKENSQADQLFPFIGRKELDKSSVIVKNLSKQSEVVCDPFAGSGILAYAAALAKRKILANEWEPYTFRLATSVNRLPSKTTLDSAVATLKAKLAPYNIAYYATECSVCGSAHIMDSLFYDRIPLRYTGVVRHGRLGSKGETVTFRRKYKCSTCGNTEKHFDTSDQLTLNSVNAVPLSANATRIFTSSMIENSRINLNSSFTTYGRLFPQRSQVVLDNLWHNIPTVTTDTSTIEFLKDAFLSILPQAKFKDYRSKSQDLHCPNVTLRENNIYHRFFEQIEKRYKGLSAYGIKNELASFYNEDFRDFMRKMQDDSIDLIFSDPPWSDGNAYFERGQLYHPWLNYSLSSDHKRLTGEMVVTDAPSRASHDAERWWTDFELFFNHSHRILKDRKFMALYFRPIPARNWLANLNRIKFIARKCGFEPLVGIDLASSDPSMRIQQSASYIFSQDIVMVFLNLSEDIRRTFVKSIDIDHLIFKVALNLQDESGAFTYRDFARKISDAFISHQLHELNLPKESANIKRIFDLYCEETSPGHYLTKHSTPFSDQLHDLPLEERLFTYVPAVIDDLSSRGQNFSYAQFVLKLSQYVENGTRELIGKIEKIKLREILETYALPIGANEFSKRPLPDLPVEIRKIVELDPYDFEAFIANLLKEMGFTSVVLMGRSGDRGVDIRAIDPAGESTIVQCKRYVKNNVDATPIQRLHSFALTRGVRRKITVTTSAFTEQAIQEAELAKVELIDGGKLTELIAQYLPEINA